MPHLPYHVLKENREVYGVTDKLKKKPGIFIYSVGPTDYAPHANEEIEGAYAHLSPDIKGEIEVGYYPEGGEPSGQFINLSRYLKITLIKRATPLLRLTARKKGGFTLKNISGTTLNVGDYWQRRVQSKKPHEIAHNKETTLDLHEHFDLPLPHKNSEEPPLVLHITTSKAFQENQEDRAGRAAGFGVVMSYLQDPRKRDIRDVSAQANTAKAIGRLQVMRKSARRIEP